MQSRFIKTAIALSISAIGSAAFAADAPVRQLGEQVLVDGVANRPSEIIGGYEIGSDNATTVIIKASGTTQYNDKDGNPVTMANKAVWLTGEDNSTILGKNIDITSELGRAVQVDTGAKLKLGSSNTEEISITSSSMGIFVLEKAQLSIESKKLTVTENSESGFGIHVQNNSQVEDSPSDAAHLTIKADEIVVNSKALGLSAFSNGKMDIEGNITVNAMNAIDVRGNSIVNVNVDGKHSTVLNGDIVFETPATPDDPQNSGNLINSHVTVGLHGEGSSWTGRAYQTYQVKKGEEKVTVETVALDNGEVFFGNVDDFKLDMTNGAQWNMTGDSFVNDIEVADGASINMQSDAEVFNVDGLALENAAVNMQGGENQKATINRLSARNASLNMRASTEDGKTVKTAQFEVLESVEDGSDIGVTLTGITSDDIEDAQAAMDSVKDAVVAKGATIDKTITEGDIRGAITERTAANGTRSDVQTAENTKLLSMKGVNAAALVAWRDEVAYTNQRMEFLRDNSHAYGAWAQVYGGESAYDDASVDLTTTTVQVGADATIGDWVAGAAFSYMNGDADMSNGQADTDAYTLSLYASRMFDSGLFVNGLARYGRLSTDATAGNMDGSYDNNAFSVGGNVGYRFTFAEQAFVEPMFGLQYAYVTGDDYKASNGVKVEQDDFDALIASLGIRTGFDFAKDAGKLYARASVNHDFLGEVDGKASKADLAESMYVDLGGTWFTYGVGTQFNITDNLSVWGNVDRTTGGEVSTRYMMNAGLRYVF